MISEFYEREFYAEDWGGADEAYAAAVAEFERLRVAAGLALTRSKDNTFAGDEVSRPMLVAEFPHGGSLFVMPTIKPDSKDPVGTRRLMYCVRAQHPNYPTDRIRVRPTA